MIKNILAAAAFGMVAMGAQAASANLLADGNFESTNANFGGSSYCYVPDVGGAAQQCGNAASGWDAGVFLKSGSDAWGNPAGQSHTGIDLGTVVAGIQGASSLSTTDFSFVVGQEYLITWDSTGRSNNGGVQPYTVTAGGVTDSQLISVGPNGWQSFSFDFVATSTSGLVFQGTVSADNTAFVDNVSISAVPEASSMLMMSVATLGLLAWRRRRSQG